MAKRSIYTDIVNELVQEIGQTRDHANRHHDIPFMEEKVSHKELRRRLSEMNRQQLKDYMTSHSMEDILSAFR